MIITISKNFKIRIIRIKDTFKLQNSLISWESYNCPKLNSNFGWPIFKTKYMRVIIQYKRIKPAIANLKQLY